MSKKLRSVIIVILVLLVGGGVITLHSLSDRRFLEQLDKGISERENGHIKAAEVEIKKAISMRPDSGEAHFELGSIYLSLKKAEPARKELEKAIDLDPDSADSYLYLSFVYFNLLKQKEKAVTLVGKAVKIEPRNYQYHLTQGIYLERLGRDRQAISQYEVATRLAPSIPGLKKRLIALRAKEAAKRQ